MDLIRVPHLDEVRPVSPREMQAHGPTTYLLNAMGKLGVGCFEDEAGNYWFGSGEADAIEHDRWLCTVGRKDLRERGYGANRVRLVLGCERWQPEHLGQGDVTEILTDLARTRELALISTSAFGPHAAQTQVGRNFLIAVRETETLRVSRHGQPRHGWLKRLEVASRIDWTQTRHDILHHWDTWCAAENPDGLPRDLVLRMYGLQAFLPGGQLGTR